MYPPVTLDLQTEMPDWLTGRACPPHRHDLSVSSVSSMDNPGLTNLWHAYPERRAASLTWYAAFSAALIHYFFTRPASKYREELCIYTHIPDCVETLYDLPLLSNNATSQKFLHKSEAVRSVDWIFIAGSSAWRWLGEYVTLDRTFYSLLL